MSVAYVCTNFNNSDETRAAVLSLRRGDGQDCPVFVVDNASEQRHVDILRSLAADDDLVTAIELDENIGYFRGLNVGLAKARQAFPDVEVVVAGNNDLLFPDNFVESINRIQNRFETHAVVAPDIVTADGEHQNPHVISGISKPREIMYDLFNSSYLLAKVMTKLASQLGQRGRRGDEDHHATGMEISQGHGSCYLLGPRFFRDFGEFWAPTFLFGEEYFLSLQLERKGQKVFYDPAVTVTHLWHASVGALPSLKRWELGRDAHRVYRKHNPIWARRK